MYYGAGAGGDATASAVVAAIVDIVRGNTGPMLGYKKGLEGGGLELLASDKIVTNYYLRMEVDDQSGVLAKITNALEKFEISIESMLQKPHKNEDRVKLLFTTHKCQEAKIQEAMVAFKKLDCVHGEIAMMRIEK
jgi:homoserine dehydrogenase